MIVSAILYSEIINSITSLQDYLLVQQLMRKSASAAVAPSGAILCILWQCAITKRTIAKTPIIKMTKSRLTTAIITLNSKKILN